MLGEDYVPATTRAGGFRGLQAESSVRTGGTLSPDPRSASGEIAVMGEGSRMYPGLPQGRRNNGFTAVQVAAARVVDPAQTERMPGRIRVDRKLSTESTSAAAGLSTRAPSDTTRSWA